MKRFTLRLFTLATAILGFTTLGAAHAYAQAKLIFAGDLGAPLTLILNAPVTYAITTASNSNGAPIFVFQGVVNVFGDVSGKITFTINDGTARTLSTSDQESPAATWCRRTPCFTALFRAWRWATRQCSRPAR